MAGKLLLRFDDICPTMNWPAWRELERTLIEEGVKPLLAVIPDNRDRMFEHCAPRRDFWDEVRLWQARGWTIGVHGYQHFYATRCSGLLGINAASEFAGLPAGEQERKVRLALEIFRREGLDPEVWVAPGHSFDTTTLQALSGSGLKVVSDGLSIFPYEDRMGLFWIPQQMWRFRHVPFGVWTICFHHNSWRNGSVDRFRDQLRSHRGEITTFEAVIHEYRGRAQAFLDRAAAATLGSSLQLKCGWQRRHRSIANA